ncbi:Fis family transcriptional regulator [Gordonia humi]|uniref:Fis family transcriptional regulator n=1 Tax=Gordonia humi TaxID=686429 RepID=UPI00361122C0
MTVDEDFSACDPVLRAARPVLDAASTQLVDTGLALLLTDAESRIIAGVYGGAHVERSIDSTGAVRGSHMGEDAVGTTALGTPVETRSSITVNGDEHFLELYKHLSCHGEPIVHPTTRRLEGILCMTEVAGTVNPLFRSYVERLVSDITSRLLDTTRASHRAVLDAFHRTCTRRDVAVVGVGDDVCLTNDLATALLDQSDLGALKAFAVGAGTLPEEMLTAAGLPVSVAGTRVPGAPNAAVFTLIPAAPSHHPVPRGSAAHGRSPVLFDAPSFDSGSALHARSLAVSGESGTGRTTYAAAATSGLQTQHVDIPRRIAAGERLDLPSVAARARSDRGAVIVDGVDLLAGTDLSVVRQLMVDRQVPVVLVSGPTAHLRPEVASVVSLCDDRAVLAPVRHRTNRIAALAAHFIGPDTTCSPGAIDALMAHDWPANLTELDRARRGSHPRRRPGLAAPRRRRRSARAVSTVVEDVDPVGPGALRTRRHRRRPGPLSRQQGPRGA